MHATAYKLDFTCMSFVNRVFHYRFLLSKIPLPYRIVLVRTDSVHAPFSYLFLYSSQVISTANILILFYITKFARLDFNWFHFDEDLLIEILLIVNANVYYNTKKNVVSIG